MLILCSVERDKVKKKSDFDLESLKAKLPPRPPKDKPVVSEVKDTKLTLTWPAAELPAHAVQTPIYYIVERRCPPSKNWIEIATDVEETKYVMSEYKAEKDYMFRIRASNQYGMSEPSLSTTLFSKPG